MFSRSVIDVKVKVFLFKCLNATIPLTCTVANEYPSSNMISKKNCTGRGVCITCDILFFFKFFVMKHFCHVIVFIANDKIGDSCYD